MAEEQTIKRICVFGSSSQKTSHVLLEGSFRLGECIADSGHTLVFGGGRHGCMGAVQRGCRSKDGKVIGIVHEIFLPGNETAGLFDDLIVASGPTLTDRKRLLYEHTDAIIVLPGGVGTFDELMETTCMRSLRMNNFENVPICILNIDGFYDHTVAQMRRAAADGVLYGEVEAYFHVSNTPEEALAYCLSELGLTKSDKPAEASVISETDEKH